MNRERVRMERMLVGLLLGGVAWLGPGAPAAAQTALQVLDGEMSVPFGSAEVRLVLVADHLLVVDGDDPSEVFAIDRANVDGVEQDGDTVTISLGDPVRDQRQIRFRTAEGAAIARWSAETAGSSAAGASGEDLLVLQAKHEHMMLRGSCVGQLTISGDRVSFESLTDSDHSRQWFFRDIREVEQDGIYKLGITPFLANGYDFELTGRGLNSREYRELVDAVAAARAR